jgi:hypothetical protein
LRELSKDLADLPFGPSIPWQKAHHFPDFIPGGDRRNLASQAHIAQQYSWF